MGEMLLIGDDNGGTQLFDTVSGDVCPKYGTEDEEEHELVRDNAGNFQLVGDVNKVVVFVSYFSLKFTNRSQSSSKMLFRASTVLPMSDVPENCGMVCLILSMRESLLPPLLLLLFELALAQDAPVTVPTTLIGISGILIIEFVK